MSTESEKSFECSLRDKIPASCDGCVKLGKLVGAAAWLDDRLVWRQTSDAFRFTHGMLRLANFDVETFDEEMKALVEKGRLDFKASFGVGVDEVVEAYPDEMSTDAITAELLNRLKPGAEAEFKDLAEEFNRTLASCPIETTGDTCTVE